MPMDIKYKQNSIEMDAKNNTYFIKATETQTTDGSFFISSATCG